MTTFKTTRVAVLLGLAALLVLALPLTAAGADGYRADTGAYNEEGFGLVATYAPYTAYRADTGAYNEEGFGYVR